VKYNDLAQKKPEELKKTLEKLREELFHLNIKAKTAQLEKKSEVKRVRKDIARIQTKLSELRQAAA
jgi:large subunit ribosomal protein L29